ncbi:MAG: YbaB/EbfC family nucleoid-associated protein, partial [Clostridia bacterium]|nr:YbaB/EbfC family nucleoid-associated protein [Clostridia bacterium]
VKATVTGKMEVKSIEIKPEIIDPDDAEMLSDLVMAAVNEALRAAENDKNERMGAISGGLNLPGMF